MTPPPSNGLSWLRESDLKSRPREPVRYSGAGGWSPLELPNISTPDASRSATWVGNWSTQMRDGLLYQCDIVAHRT